MVANVLDVVGEYVSKLRSSRYRGLLVVTGVDGKRFSGILKLLASHYPRLLLCTRKHIDYEHSEGLGVHNVLVAGYSKVKRLLGYEFDGVLLDVDKGLEPNIIGLVGEMVRGGGILALFSSKNYDDIDLGFPGGLSYYTKYVKKMIGKAKNLLVVDGDYILLYRVIDGIGSMKLVDLRLRKHNIYVHGLKVSPSQLEWIDKFIYFMKSGRRLLLGVGDRGRGKSAAIGIALGIGCVKGYYSEVPVVASSEYSVQSLFMLLEKTLSNLGLKVVVKRRGDLVYAIEADECRISYMAPWEVDRGYRLLVIDEAAAIGASRLRRLLAQSRKIVATTTVHGYEGSGRTAVRVIHSMVKAVIEHVFREPIRYPIGDPLEQWIYDTFLLNVEPEDRVVLGQLRYNVIDRKLLVEDPTLLRRIYGILVLAHYRNEPNDLALLLDNPRHFVRAISSIADSREEVVGVAQVAVEGPLSSKDVEVLRRGLSIKGVLLLDKMFKYANDFEEELTRLKAWRIVRIAVTPSLQRRGIGSRLLRELENEALENNIDFIGAMFSGHDVIDFWVKNNYKVFYISPRFNKITGEKNIGVIKPLSREASRILDVVLNRFKSHLLWSLHVVYRDLAVEKIHKVLSSLTPTSSSRVGLCLTKDDLSRLKAYLEYKGLHESYYDVLHKLVLISLAEGVKVLDEKEELAVIARSLQGKPINDVASILGLGVDEVKELVEKAYKKLAKYFIKAYRRYLCTM